MDDFSDSRTQSPNHPLPYSVEALLQQLCTERSLSPPNDQCVSRLAQLDEETSKNILNRIRSTSSTIRNLSAYIIHMVKNATTSSSSSSSSSPLYSPVRSVFLSSTQQSSSSPQQPRTSTDIPNKSNFPNPENSCTGPSLTSSSQLIALGQLEFRKTFLILNYCGGKKLEDVISTGTIIEWKQLSMRIFEDALWNAVGSKNVRPEDRLKTVDWDSGNAYCYECHVFSNGSKNFKGPFLSNQRTHLQRVVGDDNVLNVKFAEDRAKQNNVLYKSILRNGIFIGLRCYRFFVFKDGGKEQKKKNPTSSPVRCFFVRMESTAASDKNDSYALSGRTMFEARSLFMHIHMASSVSEYMSRFSLILSKTMKLDDLKDVIVEIIDDIPCLDDNGCIVYNKDGERLIHTDGTGFISEDLALKCPLNIFRGFNNESSKRLSESTKLEDVFSERRNSKLNIREMPLLIQFRMFNNGLAAKGTVLVNRKLQPKTIQIRPSMIKIMADSKCLIKTVNSLEIVGTSNRPKNGYLSKYLILLLTYGGVPGHYFINILRNVLEESHTIYTNNQTAAKVSLQYSDLDGYALTKMIFLGIPLNEPWLQHQLSIFSKNAREGFKNGKIPLSDCFHLMGTVDPTDTLRKNEVCIILQNGQVSGEVLVFKHPGLHFGDIHVLNSTYVKALDEFVGNAKYAIFFSTKGPRSLADEIANSDFDGDMYWISRNPQLVGFFKESQPWTASCTPKSIAKKPCEMTGEELEQELFQFFLATRFQHSRVVSLAADSWLAFMDRLVSLGDDCAEEKEVLKQKILELVDIYYCVLDAPKSGIKVDIPKDLVAEKLPHYLRRKNCYKSTSILGQIYDEVELFESKMEASKGMVEIWQLPCFDVEVPKIYIETWEKNYAEYRDEMKKAMKHEGELKNYLADEVIKKYKQLLYGAPEFEESQKNIGNILDEALAIYQVCYKYANTKKSASLCGFAWKVAGSALCELYSKEHSETFIKCSASFLKDVCT